MLEFIMARHPAWDQGLGEVAVAEPQISYAGEYQPPSLSIGRRLTLICDSYFEPFLNPRGMIVSPSSENLVRVPKRSGYGKYIDSLIPIDVP